MAAYPCSSLGGVLQVGRDATAQLQQDMHNIFEAWLGHRIVLTQPGPGESGPSISGSVGGHVVLLVKVMTDQGGDARAELLVRSSPAPSTPVPLCTPPSLGSFDSIHVFASS